MALDTEKFRQVRLKSAEKAKKKLPIAIVLTLALLMASIYGVWNNQSASFPPEVFGLALLTALSLFWSVNVYVSANPNLEEGDEFIRSLNRKYGNKRSVITAINREKS